ncbi:hypothetical protein ACWEPZ_17720 [Streptomyces sp. NPDC004288]
MGTGSGEGRRPPRACRCGAAAALVGFLISDEAAFITGASIPIGGGIGMGL